MAEPRWNRSLIALVAAWVVVLAALAGAAGYVALHRLGTEGSGSVAEPEKVAPQEEPRRGMVLELPATQPLANGGQANGSRATATVAAEQSAAPPAESAEPAPQASDSATAQATSSDRAASSADESTGETGGADQSTQDQAALDQASEMPSSQDEALPAAPEQQSSEPLTEGGAEATASDDGAQSAASGQQEAAQEQALQGEGAGQGAAVPQQEARLPPSDEPPWQQYARAFDQSKRGPRVAIVLTGLGLSAAATEAAIKQLPPEITLSFSPYARLLNQWIALARANGHEVMLDLPMEPLTFPEDDPGPHALLTVLDEEQNEKRLDWLLRRGSSYVGVSVVMGSRFTASAEHMKPILDSLKERGLLLLDNRSSEESAAPALAAELELPLVVNDRTLDSAQASRVAINARLSEIERLARENGAAVAMAQPYPVTIERLRDWSAELATRGFVLAPITALAATTAMAEQ